MKRKITLLSLLFFMMIACQQMQPKVDISFDPSNPEIGQIGYITWEKLSTGDYQFDYTNLGIDPNITSYYIFKYSTTNDFSNFVASVGFDTNPSVWFASWPDNLSNEGKWNTCGYYVPANSNNLQPIIPKDSGFKMESIKSVTGYISYTDNNRKIGVDFKGIHNGNGEVAIVNIKIYNDK